jgi:hypothetical protein
MACSIFTEQMYVKTIDVPTYKIVKIVNALNLLGVEAFQDTHVWTPIRRPLKKP